MAQVLAWISHRVCPGRGARICQEFTAAEAKKRHTRLQRVLCREASRPAEGLRKCWQNEFCGATAVLRLARRVGEIFQLTVEAAVWHIAVKRVTFRSRCPSQEWASTCANSSAWG